MSSNNNSGSKATTWIGIILGAAMAVGGYWVSVNVHPDFLTKLNEQGIPLDLGKTLSSIGMFLVLFPVLKFFYFNPLGEAIHERTTSLEKTFSEAEDLRAEMTQMRSDYERRMAAKEAEARDQIQAQIKEAQQLRQTLMSEAAAKADELLKQATQEIESERARVKAELRLEVVNLTLSATEKLLGENVNSATNRRLVEEFISKIEVEA